MSKLIKKPEEISNIFAKIFKTLENDLKKVDQTIINNSSDDAQLIKEITNHITSAGGKRVRPILTILSAKLCNYDVKNSNNHINLAAAVELIHTATLLHDDVVDEGELRRGKKTANAIWGNKASILVGDYLLSTAFQLMVKCGSLPVLDLLSSISRTMSNGEVLQLTNSTNIEIEEEQYFEIISQKTAILFAAATQVGAMISNVDKNKEQALQKFGDNLGIAFQIIDDVLDYSSSSQDLGKEIGDDFFEGKVTLPIIITFSKANEAEKKRIRQIFNENLISEEKNYDLLTEMMDLIKKYQAIELSLQKAMQYRQKAADNLEYFADCEEKEMLISIVDYAVTRKK